MGEKRPKGVPAQHYYFAEILNEANERTAKGAKKSNEHFQITAIGGLNFQFQHLAHVTDAKD
jgi:hypothetical protein